MKSVPQLSSPQVTDPEFLVIRSFQPQDAEAVKRICNAHFRSLAGSAVMYFLVQNAEPIAFQCFLLLCLLSPIKCCLFCSIFLLYLYLRARLEFEGYIRHHCGDIRDISQRYLNSAGSCFWVAELQQSSTQPSNSVFPLSSKSSHSQSSQKISKRKRLSKSSTNEDTSTSALVANSLSNFQENELNTSTSDTCNNKMNITNLNNLVNESPISQTDSIPVSKENKRIVGCIGFFPYPGNELVGQMVRLVVSHEARRMRIGSRLVAHLEDYATQNGYEEVLVSTSSIRSDSIRFVRKNGYYMFNIIKRNLSRGDLILWKKHIKKTSDVRPKPCYDESKTFEICD